MNKEIMIEPYGDSNSSYITLSIDKDKSYKNLESVIYDNGYLLHQHFMNDFVDNVIKINVYTNTKIDIYLVLFENSDSEFCFNCDSKKGCMECVKELSELLMNCLKSQKLIKELYEE
jgi:hypothetical protein